jgi:microsomal epoxide hydrolase
MALEPFRIAVADEVLADLHRRLSATRWIDDLGEPGWKLGLSVPYLRELAGYWRSGFDWRAQEATLNAFAQFRVTLKNGLGVHFVHERGRGPNPLPLVLTHGFPDSFARFTRLIPLLVDPAGHGGDAEDAFDVVAPSLPGYGFSDRPAPGHALFPVGDLWHELLTQHLGYERYAAHGGDWGSLVTELLARDHAGEVVGIHLTDVPFIHAFQKPDAVTHAEKRYLDAVAEFPQKQGAYALIQGSEPQVAALALGDSPVGLAGWILEKFRRWSDCDGDLESRFTRDELLTQVMLYWVTGTIASSFLPYYDVARAGAATWMLQKLKALAHRTRVPAAFAMFPKDLSSPPREWAERFFDVGRWTEMPRGGHFAALEEPELLAQDLRAFFRPLRTS